MGMASMLEATTTHNTFPFFVFENYPR